MVDNPSFRPRFNVHWSVSILGALGCYGAMFLINPIATVVAIVTSYGIYFYLEERSVARTWGDLRSGIWFALARRALLNLERHRFHAKNWRPNILVFTGQPHNREELVAVAEWLNMGKGIVSFFQLLVGDVEKMAGQGLRHTARRQIRSYIQDRQMTAFAEADVVADFFHGALTVAQSHGLSGLEPNTVLLGWSRTQDGRIMQMRLMHNLVKLHKSVLFLRFDEERGFGRRKNINVWWRGRSDNADLIMLLAHLISRHSSWEGAHIRLLRVINSEEGRIQTEAHLKALLEQVRVEADPIVIVRDRQGQTVTDVIMEWSRDADLTLLGMDAPAPENAADYAARLDEFILAVGTTLLVRSGEEEELLEPDEG
jgi:PHD/YefM family antitoxin component YafN of YafNO toxin-antitoxin module